MNEGKPQQETKGMPMSTDWDAELTEIAKTAVNRQDCDHICDYIVKGELTEQQALRAFGIALQSDPTESYHAAHIRDAIRDNFEGADI
jgi:phenylalanine-4-hydroxylase